MACFFPLRGYRSGKLNASGKRSIVFNPREGIGKIGEVKIPCGQCVGCRLERSRQWAMRCVHEASLYERNCFLTLTVADEHLSADRSLDKSLFQKFMKRLRKRYPHEKIRYFHCGEYGELYGRPHYHVCLFNFDFPDKYYWTQRKSFPVWRSNSLEDLWPLGNSEIGSVTFESAAYVARYIMKKITGPLADEHYGSRIPEYVTMSRGGRKRDGNLGGIGAQWFEKFGSEVYPSDFVVMRGKVMKPPKFYDSRYELIDGDGALEVARERRRKRRLEDETPERLIVREKVTRARLALSQRGLENG